MAGGSQASAAESGVLRHTSPPPLPWLRSVLGADSAPFQKHGRAIPSTFLGSPVAQSHKLPPLPAEKIEENGQ